MRTAFRTYMRILVADDDAIVRAVVQRVAAQASHELLQAEDGLEALRVIELEDPDLLITDVHMPVLDGFELVAAVRSSARHRAMPIVCLSAENDREAVARLAALGITDYLLKPIRPRDLADRLTSVVQRHGKWKHGRNPENVEGAAANVLVVDPDATFRAMIVGALAPEYSVVEAMSGPNGVTLFRSQTSPITAVLLAEGLELLHEERVVGVLRRLATEQGMRTPPMLLVTASAAVAPEKAAAFDGVVRRTVSPDEFVAAVSAWLPKEAPCPTA
jgi:two-component system cell cycle response regulator